MRGLQRFSVIDNPTVGAVGATSAGILNLSTTILFFLRVVSQIPHELQPDILLSLDVVGPDHLGLIGAIGGLVYLRLRLFFRERIDPEPNT